jgi:3-phenylpropionate/trans-cinnamate dioxygenase ferredoxin component
MDELTPTAPVGCVLSSDLVVEGAIHTDTLAGEPIAITRSAGRVYAFVDRCSHQECPLSSGFVEDGELECECHGARFELATGRVTLPPAVEPITMLDAVEADGQIHVRRAGAPVTARTD